MSAKSLNLILAVAGAAALNSGMAQTTLAQWTFETSIPGGSTGITGTSISGIAPEVGAGAPAI